MLETDQQLQGQAEELRSEVANKQPSIRNNLSTLILEARMKSQPESRREKFLDGVRVFNKHIFNRFTLLLARAGAGPFSVISHTGRKSGRSYHTPVLATYTGKTIIIPLSYGDGVDWLRNILAQGGCEITHKKKRLRAANPQVIDLEAARSNLSAERYELFKRFKLEKVLLLQESGK